MSFYYFSPITVRKKQKPYKKERVPGLKPGTLIRQALAKSNLGLGCKKINILQLGKIFIILK